MAPLPIFVINLDRSPERLTLLRAQAHASGLSFERISAIDGTRQLPSWAAVQFMNARGGIRGGLSEGEVGCYASHLLVLSKIIERRIEAAIVLEDDAILDEDFERKAREAIRAAPSGWDCIHLSTDFKRSPFPVADLGSEHCLVRYMRLPVNSVAYAISLAGAQKLMAPRYRVRPFDVEFRLAWESGLEMLGTFPAIARPHEYLASTIDADWKKDRPVVGWRRRKSRQQAQWKPGLVSQIRGWLYVTSRLGIAGAWHCWTTALPDRAHVSGRTPVGSLSQIQKA